MIQKILQIILRESSDKVTKSICFVDINIFWFIKFKVNMRFYLKYKYLINRLLYGISQTAIDPNQKVKMKLCVLHFCRNTHRVTPLMSKSGFNPEGNYEFVITLVLSMVAIAIPKRLTRYLCRP